jgi:hypothetical protein
MEDIYLTKKNQKTHLSNRLQLLHVLIIIGTRSLDISQYFEVMLKTIQVCEYVCRPETMKTVKNNTFTVPYASLNRKFLKTDNSEFIGEKVISI